MAEGIVWRGIDGNRQIHSIEKGYWNGMARKNRRGRTNRRLDFGTRWSLLGGVLAGCVGVLVDADHILCGIAKGIPIWDVTRLYGCKVWHHLILPVGCCLGGIGVALFVGCLLVMVECAAQSALDDTPIETRKVGESRR